LARRFTLLEEGNPPPKKLSALKNIFVAGSAVAKSLLESLEKKDLE